MYTKVNNRHKHKVDRVITNLMLVKWLNWKAISIVWSLRNRRSQWLCYFRIQLFDSHLRLDSTRCTHASRLWSWLVKLKGFSYFIFFLFRFNWMQLSWTHNFLIDRNNYHLDWQMQSRFSNFVFDQFDDRITLIHIIVLKSGQCSSVCDTIKVMSKSKGRCWCWCLPQIPIDLYDGWI
jgi:hypothetical protein